MTLACTPADVLYPFSIRLLVMSNHLVVLQIQHELADKHKDVANTTAGEAIDWELKGVARWHCG